MSQNTEVLNLQKLQQQREDLSKSEHSLRLYYANQGRPLPPSLIDTVASYKRSPVQPQSSNGLTQSQQPSSPPVNQPRVPKPPVPSPSSVRRSLSQDEQTENSVLSAPPLKEVNGHELFSEKSETLLSQLLSFAVRLAESTPQEQIGTSERQLFTKLGHVLGVDNVQNESLSSSRRKPLRVEKSIQELSIDSKLLSSLVRVLNAKQSMASAACQEAGLLIPTKTCNLFIMEQPGILQDVATRKRIEPTGIVGHVTTTGKPIVLTNAKQHPYYNPLIDPQDTSSYACLPAHWNGQVVCVGCLTRQEDDPFTDAEIHLFGVFLSVVSSVLCYQNQVKRLEDVLQYVGSLMQMQSNLSGLYSLILSHSRYITGASESTLFLISGDNKSIYPYSKPQDSLPIDKGITGYVAKTGMTVNTNSAMDQVSYDASVDGVDIQSMLCIALRDGTSPPIAVLRLSNKSSSSKSGFNDEEVVNCSTFLKYASMALHHAQLYKKSEQIREQTQDMMSFTQSVSSTDLTKDSFLPTVMDKVVDMIQCSWGILYKIDWSQETMEAHLHNKTLVFPINKGIVSHVARTGQMVNVVDASKDTRFHAEVDHPVDIAQPTNSLICAPVKSGDTIVAVVLLSNKKSPSLENSIFTSDDELKVSAISQAVGTVLNKMRVLQQALFERKKSEMMLELAKSMSMAELESDTLVDRVIENARLLTNAERCSLFVPHRGQLEAHLEEGVVRVPMDVGIAGHVAMTGETVNLTDAYKDPRFNPDVDRMTGYKTTSILCMPVLCGREIVAVAQLVNKKSGDSRNPHTSFSKQDEEIFYTFSIYAGVTLRNAQAIRDLTVEKHKSAKLLELAHALSANVLSHEKLVVDVVEYARELTEADRCFLYFVDNIAREIEGNIDGKTVRIPIGTGIPGFVATNGETLNIEDAYTDPRFHQQVDIDTQYKTKSVLCMPIKCEGSIVAVAELVNKRGDRPFTKKDEDMFYAFATWAGVSLKNSRVHEQLVKEKRKNRVLADVVSDMTIDLRKDGVVDVIEKITSGAKDLLKADRCTVFVVDKEQHELYSWVAQKTGGQPIRLPISTGIAGEVARSGKTLNIVNAYDDERFNSEIDKRFGYRTKCLLTMPIMHDNDVVAVIQLCNKTDGENHFTEEDQELLGFYALVAGKTLSNCSLYDFVLKSAENAAQVATVFSEWPSRLQDSSPQSKTTTPRNNSSANLKTRRTGSLVGRLPALSVEITDARSSVHYASLPVLPEELERIKTREFDIHEYRAVGIPSGRALHLFPLIVELFKDIGVLDEFAVDINTLYQFLIAASRLYRSVPYHNVYHAFDVCHTVYLLLQTLDDPEVLDPVDKFQLLITAILHDVDHMGLNNSFHIKTETPLGILSTSSGTPSVLEMHHCSLAIDILAINSFNVFATLTPSQHTEVFKGMIDCILATDMAKHKELAAQVDETLKSPRPTKSDPNFARYKALLMKMIVKSADISNIVKPFEISRQWAILVTEEFHSQGDVEKEKGLEVPAMFDRSKAELANGQIGFIDFIGKGHFEQMVQLNKGWMWALENLKNNRKIWEDLKSNK